MSAVYVYAVNEDETTDTRYTRSWLD